MLRKAMHQHQRRTRSIVTKMNANVGQSNPQMWPVVEGANLRQRRENEQCPKTQNSQQIHPVRALDRGVKRKWRELIIAGAPGVALSYAPQRISEDFSCILESYRRVQA